MNLQEIQNALPDHAKDLRLNLRAIQTSDVLDDEALWGTIVASAIACREPRLLRAAEASAAEHLTPEALDAARAAAAIMGMNNVYYRFLHLVEDATYATLPARLRMQRMANPGVDEAHFELWSLAVSAVHGCGRCITTHEKKLRSHDVGPMKVQEAVRVAAVLHGVAGVLAAEAARSDAAAPAA